MYYISKTFEVSSGHSVRFASGECERPHGHNYKITVFCKSETLDAAGMVVNFDEIKKIVKDRMDHQNLNEVFDFNPTAENIAKWIADNVPKCWRAEVRETESNWAAYEIMQ